MAAIDCCTREIVGWHLELRCRAKEAITLVEGAVAARGVPPGTLTLGTDNGSAFTARAFKLVLCGLGSRIDAAATATPSPRRSSTAGSPGSRNAASGFTSSRPSTRPAP
jgi:transposase InsO family protein